MTSESRNIRLDGIKEEPYHFKNDFRLQLPKLCNSLNEKLDIFYKLLGESNINGTVRGSLKSVEVSIIEALKAENSKFNSKVDSLDAKSLN